MENSANALKMLSNYQAIYAQYRLRLIIFFAHSPFLPILFALIVRFVLFKRINIKMMLLPNHKFLNRECVFNHTSHLWHSRIQFERSVVLYHSKIVRN